MRGDTCMLTSCISTPSASHLGLCLPRAGALDLSPLQALAPGSKKHHTSEDTRAVARFSRLPLEDRKPAEKCFSGPGEVTRSKEAERGAAGGREFCCRVEGLLCGLP